MKACLTINFSQRITRAFCTFTPGLTRLRSSSRLFAQPAGCWLKLSQVGLQLRSSSNIMALPKWGRFPCSVAKSDSFDTAKYDTIVILTHDINNLKYFEPDFFAAIENQKLYDASVEKEGCLIPLPKNHARLIFSPVGSLENDYDDIRCYADAAAKGIRRAISAGSKKALLAVVPYDQYPNATLVSLLGAFEALYVPLQYREDVPEKATKLVELGVYQPKDVSMMSVDRVIEIATALEAGRFVARDLGGGDPERMAPPKFAEYVEKNFKNSCVSVEVLEDSEAFEKDYPLFAAVNRASRGVERHRGRIIFLTYTGEGPITRTIMPVGKGITYDTGGADIKAGGIMAGMSRDKCGASAVAGFFQTLAVLRPKGLKAIGALAVARNNVGEECYVADEIITSRAGVRVRIGNTDAEGRMVMTDVLCRLKELALQEENPHLMTIATLTGHACLAVGNYTAVMDNGPASSSDFAMQIQKSGAYMGDMIEISTLRREDYNFVKSSADGEDLLQCNNKASSQTPRGHQFPAAFMILASGLDKHNSSSWAPLKYSHFDIAGSSGHVPDVCTGAPILALANYAFGDLIQNQGF